MPLASDDANRELVALERPRRDLGTVSNLNGLATLMLHKCQVMKLKCHCQSKCNKCQCHLTCCFHDMISAKIDSVETQPQPYHRAGSIVFEKGIDSI